MPRVSANIPRVSYGTRAGPDNPSDYATYVRKSARGACNSLDELINALETDIEEGVGSLVPECTTSELSLDLSAMLPLHRPHIGPYSDGGDQDLPPEYKTAWTTAEGDSSKSYPQVSVQDMVSITNQREQQIVQRAASRGILAAIEAMDGFKYTFNNAWGAKDEDGHRFSYVCQDSMQNKDRHANGFTRTQKHLKGEGERGVRKPTYDCKGSVSVKCSMSRGCVDVYYRHYAIHPKLAERRSTRTPWHRSQNYGALGAAIKGASAYDYDDTDTGGLLGRLQAEKSAFSAPPKVPAAPIVNRQQVPNTDKSLKRKRDSDPGKPLSLVELLKQSAAPPPTPAKATPAKASAHPPPVNYDLPSWQQPPPPPPAPPPVKPPNPRQAAFVHNGAQAAAPYQPPYAPLQQPRHQYAAPPVPPAQRQQRVQPPQEYFGLPKPHPKGQGLFTTMKPVTTAPVTTTYAPGQTVVAKTSCTNCRYGHKKCDEIKPICTTCSRAGRYDCVYDPPPSAYASPFPVWPAPGPNMVPLQTQSQSQPARQESPDPWFPKR